MYTPREKLQLNTTNSENDLKGSGTDLLHIRKRREHIEKGKVSVPQSAEYKPFPHPNPQEGGSEGQRERRNTCAGVQYTQPWGSTTER